MRIILGLFLVILNYPPLIFTLKLQPIQEGRAHTIQNQDDGSYLFASESPTPMNGQLGKVTTGEYTKNGGQKWIFIANPQRAGEDIYTVTPQANDQNRFVGPSQQWQLIKVGHGKRHLKNTQSQLCLQSAGRGRPVLEKVCGRDNGKQRWYIEAIN